jgi:hypothetical protein
MKILGKYWKVLLALILVAAAAWMYFNVYETEKAAYESQTKQLKTMITALETRIQENMKYADVQDKLEEATAQIEASRQDLYEHFPVDMKQEDQIMYALYLETIFGTEINLDKISHLPGHGGYSGINFIFGTPQPMGQLNDGSILMGLTMTINYDTTYEGFQDMINYLATDARIVSVQYADISYDAKNDNALGTMTLLLYILDSELEYKEPEIFQPETGKENLYN